jgi:ABC-type multidrug transport system ATPase subunit
MLRFSGVSFQYIRGVRVVRDFSAAVGGGKVTFISGPNGAGKTTLLRLGAGLLAPDGGKITRDGKCLFVPTAVEFHEPLTLSEEISYLSSVGSLDRGRLRRSLADWGILALSGDPALSELSTGWRQRLALALADAADGEIILLDEPFANLDADGADRLGAWLGQLAASGCAVMVAQHGPSRLPDGVPVEVVPLGAEC